MPPASTTTTTPRKFNREWFSSMVEDLVDTRKDMGYMDAVLELCEKHDIEEVVAATLINKSIEQHITREAMKRNMYKDPSNTDALEQLS